MNISLLEKILEQPIAFHRIFAAIAGGATEGLFLSQVYYWSFRTTLEGGWFYKSGEEWERETSLVRSEIERARKKLKALNILEEKKEGIPCQLYFRLNKDRLYELMLGAEDESLTVEKIIEIYDSALVGLSKSGLMRAKNLNIESEYVDYREVLKRNGLVCHICSQKITRGVGHDGKHLAFDHVVPLSNGGTHLFDNIKPSHAGCNLLKGAKTLDVYSLSNLSKQEFSDEATKDDYLSEPSLSKLDEQERLTKTNNLYTEITSEITYPPTPQGERGCEKKFGFEIQEEKLASKPITPGCIHPIARMESRLTLGQTVRQQRREYLEASAHPSLVFSGEDTPWLELGSTTETPLFHRPFINWGAKCLMDFSSITLERAKGNFETKLLNDPRKIAIEWRTYTDTFIHKAVVVAARVNNGVTVGQDELDSLAKNQRAFTGITPESTESIDPKILYAAQPAPITPQLESVATVTDDRWDAIASNMADMEAQAISESTQAPEGAENHEAYKQIVRTEDRDYWAKISQQGTKASALSTPVVSAQQVKVQVEQINKARLAAAAQVKAKKLERSRIEFWNNQLRSGNEGAIAATYKQVEKAGYIIVNGQVEDVEF